MKKRLGKLGLMAMICLGLSSCSKEASNEQPFKETTLKVLCDEAVYKMCEPPTSEFDSVNYKLKIELVPTVAFDCIAKLLAGEAVAIILSRDYSAREDSLMKAYKVKPHLRSILAYDALVFYTNADNQVDSLTDEQLQDIFTNTNSSISKYYPKSKINEFACNSQLSSEYYYLKKDILKNKKSAIKLKQFGSSDSTLNYVINNKNVIGIGYLSQLYKQPDLKAIPISFVDSTGKYIRPYTVHQANLVRGLYPYKVTHYLYLYDEKADAPLAYSRFMSKVAKAQRRFNEVGIVPAFGDIRITIEE